MSQRFTIEILNQKLAAGTIRGYVIVSGPKEPEKKKRKKKGEPAPTHKTVLYFVKIVESLGLPYVLEHRFHPERKWRFDLAIPSIMLGVEYEGIVSEKSRHTTISGYTKDSEKYNAAQLLGWKVYRYTTLNWKQFESDLLNLLKHPV